MDDTETLEMDNCHAYFLFSRSSHLFVACSKPAACSIRCCKHVDYRGVIQERTPFKEVWHSQLLSVVFYAYRDWNIKSCTFITFYVGFTRFVNWMDGDLPAVTKRKQLTED